MARARGPKQVREKITVINPFTKKPAEVAKKQYERLGEQRYWYTRERDRIRKTTRLKPAEKERAIKRLEKARDKGTLYKLGRGAAPSGCGRDDRGARGVYLRCGTALGRGPHGGRSARRRGHGRCGSRRGGRLGHL